MFRLISPRRLALAGAVAAATAAGTGGTVLTTHLTAASNPPAAQSQTQTQSQSPLAGTQGQANGRRHHNRVDMVIGKVTAVSSTSISLADSAGKVTTYALSPRVKAFGPNHDPEKVTSLPVGEIVIAAVGDPHRDKGTTTGNGATQPAADQNVVVRIRDTGFKAA